LLLFFILIVFLFFLCSRIFIGKNIINTEPKVILQNISITPTESPLLDIIETEAIHLINKFEEFQKKEDGEMVLFFYLLLLKMMMKQAD
jgi:hypothetical protein